MLDQQRTSISLMPVPSIRSGAVSLTLVPSIRSGAVSLISTPPQRRCPQDDDTLDPAAPLPSVTTHSIRVPPPGELLGEIV